MLFLSKLYSMKTKNKSYLILTCLFVLSQMLNSCQDEVVGDNTKTYFTKDYIFNTSKKLALAESFVAQFSEHWLDSISPYYKTGHTFSYWTNPDSIILAAVLPSTTWDTILFYPIWKVTYDDNSFSITGMPMCAKIDNDSIVFLKPTMIFETSSSEEGTFEVIRDMFEKMIIKSHYLNEDKTVDPTYWFRFLTDGDFYFRSNKENGEMGKLLLESKKAYFNHIISEFEGKVGESPPPIPKEDYSGWKEEIHPDWRDDYEYDSINKINVKKQ